MVEGSVRRAAGRVRISARLVDAATGVHLWAENYDREMEDIFAVQDEVTRRIAATLGVKIQDVATQRALVKSPAELGAYDCVLRARRYTSMLSEELHAEARDLLEQAVAEDPNYAEAHALLANVYLAMTGGQSSLLLDEESPDVIDRGDGTLSQKGGSPGAAVAPNLDLVVIEASPEETAAHEVMLEKIRKSGACVWDFD